MLNQAFFRTIHVQDGRIADSTYEEPFASLLGSHKGSMVGPRGFEPRTCGLRVWCEGAGQNVVRPLSSAFASLHFL